MTFAVVWLKEPKKRVAVEIDWVQDIVRARLFNNGTNRNQDFLVFWSSKNGIPNFGVKARFASPMATEYYRTCDGVCYLARTEHFFGKYLHAK